MLQFQLLFAYDASLAVERPELFIVKKIWSDVQEKKTRLNVKKSKTKVVECCSFAMIKLVEICSWIKYTVSL